LVELIEKVGKFKKLKFKFKSQVQTQIVVFNGNMEFELDS